MDETTRLRELVADMAAVIRAVDADHPILRRLQEAPPPEHNVLEQLEQVRRLFRAKPDPLRLIDLIVEAVGGAMQSQVRPVCEVLAAHRDRSMPYELPRPDGTIPKIDASNRLFGYCQTASVSEVLEMIDRAILKAA